MPNSNTTNVSLFYKSCRITVRLNATLSCMICKKTIKKLANTKSVWFTKVFLVWILLIHAIVYTRHIIIVRSHLIVGSDPKPICSCTSSMLVLTVFAVCTLSGAVVTAVIMALSINASTELNWDNQSRIMMSWYWIFCNAGVVVDTVLQCQLMQNVNVVKKSNR